MHRKSRRVRARSRVTGSYNLATPFLQSPEILLAQGLLDEAVSLYKLSLAILKTMLGMEHPDVAEMLACLAGLLEHQVRGLGTFHVVGWVSTAFDIGRRASGFLTTHQVHACCTGQRF